MSQCLFALSRGNSKGVFPGRPVAMVRSTVPSLHKQFLCVMDPDQPTWDPREKKSAKQLRDKALKIKKKQPPPAPKIVGSGLPVSLSKQQSKQLKVDMKADPEKALFREPLAAQAAKSFAEEHKDARTGGAASSACTAIGKRGRSAPPPISISSSEDDEDDSEDSDSDADDSDSSSEDDASKIKEGGALHVPVSSRQTRIVLPKDAEFVPIPTPHPKWRDTLWVAGPAGSGKTIWASNFIRRYSEIHPHRKIWGVCKTKMDDDDALAGIKIHQLNPSSFLGSEPGSIDLKRMFLDHDADGCLVVFDDVDSYPPAELGACTALMDDIHKIGRKMGISFIGTSHLMTDGHKTRSAINESERLVFFPQHSTLQNIEYVCCKKLGVPKTLVAGFKSYGDWIQVHMRKPHYVLGAKIAQMF